MSAPTPPSGGGIPGPGYYPDPSIPGYVRYWNGAAWVPGTSRRAQEGEEHLVAPAEHAGADGAETPADAAPAEPAEPAGPGPAGPAVSETGPVFLDDEEPEDAVPAPRGRHAARGAGADDAPADAPSDVRDAAEAAGAPSDAEGAWQAVDVVDVAERAGGRVAWGAQERQDPPALAVPAELGGGAPGPGRAGDEPRLPGARRAEDAEDAGAGAAGAAGAGQEGERAAAGSYEPDRPGAPLGRDPRVGGGSWGEQVRRLAGPAPVPAPATPGETPEPAAGAGAGSGAAGPRQGAGASDAPVAGPAPAPASAPPEETGGPAAGAGAGAGDPRLGAGAFAPAPTAFDAPASGPAPAPAPTTPEGTRQPAAGAGSGAGAADPRQGAGAYAPSPTAPDVPAALPAPTTPDLPRPQPAPAAPDVPAARPAPPPPAPTTPDLPQPRPAQPQSAPQPGPLAPPLTPAARTAPPAVPPRQPAGQLPERAARAELPQGGGAGEPPVVPWRPPASDPFGSAAQSTAPPAGLGRRLGARLVDVLLVGGVVAAVAVPLVSKSVDHVQDKIDAAEKSGTTVTVWLIDGTTGPYLALVLGLFLVLGLIVEALPTARWGRTPGKRLFGVRVLDIESQDPPETGSALRRWLTYAVFVLLPLVGLLNVLWCAFDKPWRQCWHDKAGRTYVARG